MAYDAVSISYWHFGTLLSPSSGTMHSSPCAAHPEGEYNEVLRNVGN
jgi:hypothetical protein